MKQQHENRKPYKLMAKVHRQWNGKLYVQFPTQSDGKSDAKMEWKPKTPSPNEIVRENGGANMRGRNQQNVANDLPLFAAFAHKN
jgi:hypothetical protein